MLFPASSTMIFVNNQTTYKIKNPQDSKSPEDCTLIYFTLTAAQKIIVFWDPSLPPREGFFSF